MGRRSLPYRVNSEGGPHRAYTVGSAKPTLQVIFFTVRLLKQTQVIFSTADPTGNIVYTYVQINLNPSSSEAYFGRKNLSIAV